MKISTCYLLEILSYIKIYTRTLSIYLSIYLSILFSVSLLFFLNIIQINQHLKNRENGRYRTARLRKNQNAKRKRKLQVSGNIGSGLHQTNGNARKKYQKSISANKKASRNQTLQKESYRRDKHQGENGQVD